MAMRLGLGLGLTLAQNAAASGGDFPSWLPTAPSGDRPLIYADFANGHYWGNGAVTTLSMLIIQDTDWGTFDPSSVIAGKGMGAVGGANNSPVVNPIFLGAALPECTIVQSAFLDGDVSATNGENVGVSTLELPDYSFESDGNLVAGASGAGAGSSIALMAPNAPSSSDGPVVSVALMILASTRYLDHAVGSFQGRPTFTATGSGSASPNAIGLFASWPDTFTPVYLQIVAIYAPQPDADLPTLSTP